MRDVWVALAREDIGDQHRRTTLGPLWMLFNYLALAGTFIVIFGRGGGIPHHAAYVALGLFVWFYCSEVISRAVTLFAREESFITGTPMPISVYVLRMTMQVIIRSAYAGIGCLAIVLLSDVTPGTSWLWSLAGVGLIVAVTPAVIIVFAMAGTWFPDMEFIVSNILRLGLFLTPIFWTHTGEDGIRDLIYWYNPFTPFLAIVRAPVVEGAFPLLAFAFCAGVGIVLWLLALYLLGRLRKQIVFMF